MATLDLGKIKQVWRGTYNNSTAYVVDDIVAFTDTGITSTYICVANSTGNAPSSGGTVHASWNYMAKGVADPIPTQSGQSGKYLQSNGSALSFQSVEAFVSGMIIIWSGAANAIPTGWVLCDGTNSTPNLAGKFVVGYQSGNTDYAVAQTGGAETVTLSEAQMPAHTHSATTKGSSGSHAWTQFGPGRNDWNYPGENTRGSATTHSTGGGTAHENRPPYYALCYIMKT